jgi:hypothetical protein
LRICICGTQKKPVRRSMDKLRLCTGENPDKTGVGGECAKRNIHLAGSVPFRKVDIYTCHRFILPGKTLALNSSDNFSSLLIFFISSYPLPALEKIERTVAIGTEKCKEMNSSCSPVATRLLLTLNSTSEYSSLFCTVHSYRGN